MGWEVESMGKQGSEFVSGKGVNIDEDVGENVGNMNKGKE
jgi:hypothetical protein